MLLEEQAREAQSYQKDVDGPTVPLTAEALRTLQQRGVGSSRSSQSFRPRDESGYVNSTTRANYADSTVYTADDENVTIKVKSGRARVMVNGAQIDFSPCGGGEIKIKRNEKNILNGSERSNSEYRTSASSRASERSMKRSQSGRSYTRTTASHHGAHRLDFSNSWNFYHSSLLIFKFKSHEHTHKYNSQIRHRLILMNPGDLIPSGTGYSSSTDKRNSYSSYSLAIVHESPALKQPNHDQSNLAGARYPDSCSSL